VMGPVLVSQSYRLDNVQGRQSSAWVSDPRSGSPRAHVWKR
jgi:hypothetical protein